MHPESKNQPVTLENLNLPCRYLRAKEMYYQGFEEDPCASGVYWCGKTQESFGPDGEACDQHQCCGQRACFTL